RPPKNHGPRALDYDLAPSNGYGATRRTNKHFTCGENPLTRSKFWHTIIAADCKRAQLACTACRETDLALRLQHEDAILVVSSLDFFALDFASTTELDIVSAIRTAHRPLCGRSPRKTTSR